MEYKDFRGINIFIGDTIVYPVRRGSELHLKSGLVLELTTHQDKSQVGYDYPALRIETLSKRKDPTKLGTAKLVESIFTSLQRCVVVPNVVCTSSFK